VVRELASVSGRPAPDGERTKLTAAERPFAIYARLTAKNAHAGDSRRCIVSNVENMALKTRPMFASILSHR
jgi:hypothetical protein